MRKTRVVEVPPTPARTKKIDEYFCDGCGTLIEERVDNFSRLEVRVEKRAVVSFPECGSKKRSHYSICPKCWDEKIVPALVPVLGEPQTLEDDW